MYTYSVLKDCHNIVKTQPIKVNSIKKYVIQVICYIYIYYCMSSILLCSMLYILLCYIYILLSYIYYMLFCYIYYYVIYKIF